MLRNQRALITGASKGIGREIARHMINEGYTVFGTSRCPDTIDEKISGVTYVELELNDKESIRECYNSVGDIDILINNAGQSQLGSVEEISMDKFETLFRINFFGMIDLTKLFLSGMRAKRSGIIINIGSLSGRFALPFFASYSSSKFAVSGYTQSLRYELFRFGIRVVLIEPSDIKTSISPEVFTNPDSEYQSVTESVRNSLWHAMEKADDPKVVAKRIISVLKKNKPNSSYAVGGYGPLMVFLKRLLPDKLVEKIIRRRYKI